MKAKSKSKAKIRKSKRLSRLKEKVKELEKEEEEESKQIDLESNIPLQLNQLQQNKLYLKEISQKLKMNSRHCFRLNHI